MKKSVLASALAAAAGLSWLVSTNWPQPSSPTPLVGPPRPSASPSGTAGAAKPAPALVTGPRIDPPAAPLQALNPGAAPSRTVQFTSFDRKLLVQAQAGDTLSFPGFDGKVWAVAVRLVQREADRAGRPRILLGGEITSPEGGSFSLGLDEKKFSALILPAQGDTALIVESAPDGSVSVQEKLKGRILCQNYTVPPGAEPPQSPGTASGEPAAAAPVITAQNSRPTASAVLYLDFDGENVTDPLWSNGNTVAAAAFSNAAAQSDSVWAVVADDFAPFDVNVTTELAKYNAAAPGKRMRIIVTPTKSWYPTAGVLGVAAIQSFSESGQGYYSSTIPAWAFSMDGTIISHELGHTLGLRHDGTLPAKPDTNDTGAYYGGHGTSPTSWGPIMGSAYSRDYTQWSKGEYLNANNDEDDTAIIASTANTFGFIADSVADTATPSALTFTTARNFSQRGLIERPGDADTYIFSAPAGNISITTYNSLADRPDLDSETQLLNASGQVIASNRPSDSGLSSITPAVTAGIYHLRIRGLGRGDPLGTGYTDYGSLGEYRFLGNVATGTKPVLALASPLAFSVSTLPGQSPANRSLALTNGGGGTLTYSIANDSPAWLTVSPAAGTCTTETDTITLAFNTAALPLGAYTATLTVTGDGTTGRLVKVNLLVTPDPADLAGALDNAQLAWTTGGAANWTAQSATTHDGADAAQSGTPTATTKDSWVQTTVTGPGTLEFWWKVSSEANYDVLTFLLDGQPQTGTLSGESGWQKKTVSIATGQHTLRWRYQTDQYVEAGSNAGWLDQVTYTPAGLTGFALWKSQNFNTAQQADAAISDPAADPDKDGLSNALEYAFARQPLQPDAGNLPVPALESGNITLTIPKNPAATGLTYTVEKTADLTAPSWSTTGLTTMTDTAAELKVKVTATTDVEPSAFLRIRLTVP